MYRRNCANKSARRSGVAIAIDLGIRSDQRDLIAIAAASGKPVVVVIVSGSAIMVEEWHGSVGAILQTFYSGMEGGTALAKFVVWRSFPFGASSAFYRGA